MHIAKRFIQMRWLATAIAAISIASLPPMAQAAIITYNVSLSGPNEAPPNASPGIGFGTVKFDNVQNTMEVNVSFSGLIGTTTASHIHAATAFPFTGTAGVATTTPNFVGFPLGVTSGSFSNTLNMNLASSYNPAYVTANGGTTASAYSALLAAAAGGQAYYNIHTTAVPSGEIRGFLVAAPEPSSFLLFGLAGAGILATSRRAKKKAQVAAD